jgi:hypothetical protein
LKVRVRQPAVEHRVKMKDFRRWLEGLGKIGRVHEEKEADGVGERGRARAVIRTGTEPALRRIKNWQSVIDC